MSKKNIRNTKSKIVTAAWKLFYDNGYDDTTVDEIIWESGTSKGSFYHYFESKDALLGSLAYLFDEKYEELEEKIDYSVNSIDILLFLNRELFRVVENTVDLELLKRLFSTQLITKGEKQLLDRDREYFRLLRRIVSSGLEKGELNGEMSVSDIVKYYAFCERSIMYDWCLAEGEYSLSDRAADLMPFLINKIKK